MDSIEVSQEKMVFNTCLLCLFFFHLIATKYGKGVYFARDASYSHFYAKPPDANGQRHLYYVQVLTGEYTLGSESMIVPPLKSSQGNLQYDSTVDNTANPTIFVVYHDSQNYPAYVVNYR